MLRDDQIESLENIIKYIENSDRVAYKSALLQFAAGGGKTSVMIPLLAKRFAKAGLMPVIFNTNELYDTGLKGIKESLAACFEQNVEVTERDLKHQWTEDELDELLADLNKWKNEGRCLLLKTVTWHSINLTWKMAYKDDDLKLAAAAKRVLNFFRENCIKLEDESHITSDPLQQSIRTIKPMQVIPHEQQALIMRFYDYLMGREPGCAELAGKAGIIDKSKHSVPEAVVQEIQEELANLICADLDVDDVSREDLKAYLTKGSRDRPKSLQELHLSNPEKSELVVLARAYIKTVLPYILTMQLKKDYGYSIHDGDLTAAPKHDEQDVSSHFGDRLLLMSLTVQLYQQEGALSEYVSKIIQGYKVQHDSERRGKRTGTTKAETALRKILPEQYKTLNLDTLTPKQIERIGLDNSVCQHPNCN